MTQEELIKNLQYIADSPPREYGGFHSQAIGTARAALDILNQPWLGKPNSEGYWWFRYGANYEYEKIIKLRYAILHDGEYLVDENYSAVLHEYVQGKWQKAIVTEIKE